jgi:DNA-binding transcriptional ArsR family regulator
MERDATPKLDPRLAHALAHPTRSAILRLLIGTEGLSPDSLSEKLEVAAAKVRYHVDVLTRCGAVEAVKDGGRRDELLIRLAPLASERKRHPHKVSDGFRDDVSEAQLRDLIEIAGDLGIGYDGRGA